MRAPRIVFTSLVISLVAAGLASSPLHPASAAPRVKGFDIDPRRRVLARGRYGRPERQEPVDREPGLVEVSGPRSAGACRQGRGRHGLFRVPALVSPLGLDWCSSPRRWITI